MHQTQPQPPSIFETWLGKVVNHIVLMIYQKQKQLLAWSFNHLLATNQCVYCNSIFETRASLKNHLNGASPLLKHSQCMIFHSTKRILDLCEHSYPEHVLSLCLKKTWLSLVFSSPCQFEKYMSMQACSHFYLSDVILI